MEYKIIYNRLLIFDGSYMLHRCLCQPELWEAKNSKGKKTGGIFGVLRTLYKELKTYNYYPVVVFDGGLSKRRLDIYPNYKRNQEKQLLLESNDPKTEEELIEEEFRREYSTQRNDLIQLLPLFGIPTINIKDWEGDDLIYIISKLSKDSIVVSDDKDLIQLINEDDVRRCRIRRPLRDEFIDLAKLQETKVDINEYIMCKSIVGDPSDNIPGACFQVGEKTAPGLIKLYECVSQNNFKFPETDEELTKLCKQFDIPKRKAYLNFNENQFTTNLLLTALSLVDDDITIPFIDYIIFTILDQSLKQDIEMINYLFNEHEIKSFNANDLLNRVSSLKNVLDINDIDKVLSVKENNNPNNFLF